MTMPEIWASAAGATVAGGLVATSAEWQENTTESRVQYGLILFTFSGSPNLSSVLPGHRLVIAEGEFTNAENTGGHYIVDSDNTAKTVTVKMTARLDDSLDETGATADAVINNSGASLSVPSLSKQQQGYIAGEKPNAGVFNWIFQQITRYLRLSNGGLHKSSVAAIGRSTIATSSYTTLGGEGYTVCPAKTTGIAATVGASGYADVTGSEVAPLVSASSRILVGATFSADYGGTDNSGQARLKIDGVGLASDYDAYLPVEKAATSLQYLISSTSAGLKSYKIQANGTSDVAVTAGAAWACEFPSSVAAGAANASSGATTTSTSYVDLTSMSITISPTNNPVLLLFNGTIQSSNATDTTRLRFYDGSTAYGEWYHRYHIAAGSGRHAGQMAWLTGDLNGSTTFKVQQRSGAGETVGVNERNFTAIEITGDAKSAKPAGTCAVSTSEATITDGVTSCSFTFTPGANINYLAVLTFYSERTAGAGYLTLKIKNGSTALLNIDHARDSASNYKSPVALTIPTGQLTSGVSVTITATAQASAGTFDLKSVGFFLVEAPTVTSAQTGDAASVTITNALAGGVLVNWDSQYVCSADAALSIALYEDVNGGGATKVREKILTAPGTKDTPVSLTYLREANLTLNDDVVYDVRAKIASGSVIFAEGHLNAVEVPRE